MDSQTMDITNFADLVRLITYDLTTQKFANLLDVHSLVCKIKVFNSCVLGTRKFAITCTS